MLKNYLLIALRNVKKHKGYTFINVVGLAIGMACCILLFLWVQDESAFDRFHENGDEIYRVLGERHTENKISLEATTPNPLAPTLKEQYPEVVNAARFCGGWLQWLVQYKGESFTNDRLGTADPAFFEIFSFSFVKGDPRTAISGRWTVVITESMAKKYFRDEDPMGKVLKIAFKDFKVTGVIKDVPRTSSMQFDYIFSASNMEVLWSEDLKNWERDFRFNTFVQLTKKSSPDDFIKKASGIVKKYSSKSNIARLYLQPLKDIHLYSNLELDDNNISKGSITYTYIFLLVAFGILLIACINYMNMASTQSGLRSKEIGLRKVVGAHRLDIIKQFFGESIVLSFLGLLLAIILVFLFLPVFNDLTAKQLTVNLSLSFILGLVVIALLTAVISGSYPAFILSSFQPVHAVKGVVTPGKPSKAIFRKILVVFQFTFTIFLIIGTIVIYNQLNFIKNKDMGFDRENIILFYGLGEFRRNTEAIKTELLANPNILSVAVGSHPAVTLGGSTIVNWPGKNPEDKIVMHPVLVDYDYLKTFDLKLVEGRFFDRKFSTDYSNYVVNEAAVRAMKMESPVGKRFSFGDSGREAVEGTIIGVIKDYHHGSLHNKIQPCVFLNDRGYTNYCAKISPRNVSETISFIEKRWKKGISVSLPFTYQFVDEKIDKYYRTDRKIGKVVQYFTFLAIFIALLGLQGLASFTAARRTKEIGIRKVMGASIGSINLLLSKELLGWQLLANLIAWPLAWYGMNRWLQNFSYRISIEPWTFFLAGGFALVVALLTISYHTVKAAHTNPVDNLRYE